MASKPRKTVKWSTEKLNDLIQEIIDWHIDTPDAFGIVPFFMAHKEKYPYVTTNFYNRLKQWGDEVSQDLMEQLNNLLEQRMIDNSLKQFWSASMAKFLLNTKWGYIPKTSQDIQVTDGNLKFEFGSPDDGDKDNNI
jgi:hypothetical protein